jgi:flagellar biosynthesis protein FliR
VSDDILRWISQVAPVALRIGGLLTFSPFFGDRAVPNRVKVSLLVALTALLAPVVAPAPLLLNLSDWVHMALGEWMVGLLLGLTLQVVFEAMQFAGQIAGIQLALSLSTLFDPQSNSESTALPVFFNLVALLIFLQLGVHRWILRACERSFEYLPVGSPVISELLSRDVVRVVGALFVLGIQIAGPVILATLLVDAVTSFIAKASPQFPALLIGIPLKTLTGYLVLIGAAALWPGILEHRFADAVGSAEKLLHLARNGG